VPARRIWPGAGPYPHERWRRRGASAAAAACFTRDFDGATHRIRLTPGAVTDSGAFPRTFVAIVRRFSSSTADNEALVALNATTDVNSAISFHTNNTLRLMVDGAAGVSFSTFTVLPSDGWVLVAAGKASGTATPRMHKYVYNTATWTHQDGSAAIANGTLGATETIELGAWFNGVEGADVRLAVGGVYDSNLSDANLETAPLALQALLNLTPAALWRLDQASTSIAVNDLTAGGADQTSVTGTTVVGDCPAGFDWTLAAVEGRPQDPVIAPNLAVIQQSSW
jgi:hypothetical protein